MKLVRDHGEETGPLGWAVGDEIHEQAEALQAHARRSPELAEDLRQVAARLERAAEAGQAVVGCLELLFYESDGIRTWLVEEEEA